MADDVDRAGEVTEAWLERVLASRVQPSGPGAEECDGCGEQIPAARREVVPSTRHCVDCAGVLERRR